MVPLADLKELVDAFLRSVGVGVAERERGLLVPLLVADLPNEDHDGGRPVTDGERGGTFEDTDRFDGEVESESLLSD